MMRILIIALITLNILYFVGVYLFSMAFDQRPPIKDPDIPTITLLSMAGVGEPSESVVQNTTICFTLGPFSVEKTAKLIAERISDAGFAVNIRRQQTDRVQKYLVFLPKQVSRAAAEKVVSDIKSTQIQQIKQYEIIESGPYENAIALGTFDDLDRARRHTEYVRFLGYDAKHTEQRGNALVYWVGYDERLGEPLPVIEWSRNIDPQVSVQKIPETCEF